MDIAWMTTRPIAHRGLHDDARPENSLAAFAAGMEAGYPLELDVHLTRDNELVVVHDENLKRVTGQDLKITDCPREIWRALKLCGTEEGIPTLDEVLALVDGRVGLIIEIKKDRCRKIGQLEQKLVDRLHRYSGPFVLKSFDPRVVGWMRRHAPEFFCGQLSDGFRNGKYTPVFSWFMRNLHMIRFNHAQFISFDARALPNAAVTRWHKEKGLPLLCWTIRSQEEADRAKELGADNIIFENFVPKE